MEFICLKCGRNNTLYTKFINQATDYIACHDCGYQAAIPEYRKYLEENENKNGQ